MLKTIFFKYQAAMFYISQTASEYNKVAGFVNNILLAATFLATVFSIQLTVKQLFLIWGVLMIACYLLGRFLVKIGVLEYNNRLNNANNKEIREIHEDVKLIKKYLGL